MLRAEQRQSKTEAFQNREGKKRPGVAGPGTALGKLSSWPSHGESSNSAALWLLLLTMRGVSTRGSGEAEPISQSVRWWARSRSGGSSECRTRKAAGCSGMLLRPPLCTGQPALPGQGRHLWELILHLLLHCNSSGLHRLLPLALRRFPRLSQEGDV